MPKTYEPIATTTLVSSNANITFSSIPSTYTDLVVVVELLANTTTLNAGIRFNSDNASNYSYTSLVGNGSAASSTRSAETFLRLDYFATTTTTERAMSITHIMNYANTTTNKTAITRNNRAGAAVEAFVNLWRSTSAINSVNIFARNDSFAAGSIATLYGIKAA